MIGKRRQDGGQLEQEDKDCNRLQTVYDRKVQRLTPKPYGTAVTVRLSRLPKGPVY